MRGTFSFKILRHLISVSLQHKINKMKSLEFKTIVHNGMIEIPNDNPEIKDKEVNVIILWEEKSIKENKSNKRAVKESELKGNIEDVFGLWKGKSINLNKLREEQWERKTK